MWGHPQGGHAALVGAFFAVYVVQAYTSVYADGQQVDHRTSADRDHLSVVAADPPPWTIS